MPGLEKILRGIKKYEESLKPAMVQSFKRFKEKPEPKSVMFSCMDSRVLLTRVLGSEVGDHFLVRNAGNLVPHASNVSHQSMSTEPGALELGCVVNNIDHVIVCGHSDCKAMHGLYGLMDEIRGGRMQEGSPLQVYLKRNGAPTVAKYDEWVAGGRKALTFPLLTKDGIPPADADSKKSEALKAFIDPQDKFEEADKLSQINALQQLTNIASHPILHDKLTQGQVILNAFWFDVYTGDFYMFSRKDQAFIDVNKNFDQLVKESDQQKELE